MLAAGTGPLRGGPTPAPRLPTKGGPMVARARQLSRGRRPVRIDRLELLDDGPEHIARDELAELVLQALVSEVSLLVGDQLLQPSVLLDAQLPHREQPTTGRSGVDARRQTSIRWSTAP